MGGAARASDFGPETTLLSAGAQQVINLADAQVLKKYIETACRIMVGGHQCVCACIWIF